MSEPPSSNAVQLPRHLDHRPAETRARELPLRRLVPLGGRQRHAGSVVRLQVRQGASVGRTENPTDGGFKDCGKAT